MSSHASYVCGSRRSQEKVLDFWELEFQAVVSHDEGGGNQTRVRCKSRKCSLSLSHLSSSLVDIFS